MTKDEALKLALEALKKFHYAMIDAGVLDRQEVLNEGFTAAIAIKEALAQPQRTWVGLTRAERFEIEKAMSKYYDYQHECKTVCLPEFAAAIEAKLKEKNTRQDGDCKHCVNGCPACDARRQLNVLP